MSKQYHLWNGNAAPRDMAIRNLVYGEVKHANTLVFIPRIEAVRLASTWDALMSRTWGQFRSKATPEVFQEVLDLLGLEEAPAAEERFEYGDIPALCDGDWPDWPERLMLTCVLTTRS